MRRLAWATVVLAALLLGGCGDSDRGTSGSADDLAGAWELVEGTGLDGAIQLVDGHPVTLTIEDDGEQVGGAAPCNLYGGTMEREGDGLAVTELFATEMACSPTEVMDAEQAYLTALARVDAASTEGERLTLTGPAVTLTFARLSDPGGDP